MKKISILSISLIGVISLTERSFGGPETSLPVSAEILRPLSITVTEELSFGTIMPSPTNAGTVTIDPRTDEIQTTGQ